jgi:hypothetical protein
MLPNFSYWVKLFHLLPVNVAALVNALIIFKVITAMILSHTVILCVNSAYFDC